MLHLYWSCEANKLDATRDSASRVARDATPVGTANGLQVLHIPEPDIDVLALTLELIFEQRLKTAALALHPLPQERLFVAAEWWHKFVVDRTALPAIDQLRPRLRHVHDHESLNLAVFEIHDVGDRDVGDDEHFDEIDAEPVPEKSVRDDPEKYYGRFALPEFGGANALFAAGQEAARMRGLGDTVLVGSPATFGFDVDETETSVIHWRRKRVIDVKAFGFDLSGWSSALEEFEQSTKISFERSKLADEINEWQSSGLHYGLAITLHGLNDPPVLIPMGSIYQQPVTGSPSQNLAVAKTSSHMVGAGATVPLVLPAWCLNPTFSTPHGSMSPTPLVTRNASGSQQTVWGQIRRKYRGAS